MRELTWAALGLLALAAVACGEDEGMDDAGADVDADTDADADGGDPTTGAVEVTGTWDGAVPDGAKLMTAVFTCPWTMPPSYSDLEGTVDAATGAVHGLVEEIEPGPWCLMAYVDMDPSDGLAPVAGVDAVNATGGENENGAIPIDVIAGQTTAVSLAFAIE